MTETTKFLVNYLTEILVTLFSLITSLLGLIFRATRERVNRIEIKQEQAQTERSTISNRLVRLETSQDHLAEAVDRFQAKLDSIDQKLGVLVGKVG